MVVTPIVESVAEAQGLLLGSDRIPTIAAATNDIGLSFGEDIVIPTSSIMMMKGVLKGNGIVIQPMRLLM